MKKSLLLFSAIMLGISSIAQITVTQSNVAVPGDVVIQANDTLPSVGVPTTGTNQTWNYAGLANHEEDTMFFGLPAWLNNSASFPTSNLAATEGAGSGFEIYLRNDATALQSLGIAADIFGTGTQIISITPGDVIIQFPANYGDVYATSSLQRFSFAGSEVGAPFDSIVNLTYSDKAFNIDGWGSVTTPMGTFDALRLDQVIVTTDSTFGYLFGMEQLLNDAMDTRYSVAMWSNDPSARFPLMEVEHDNAGTVYGVTWLKATPVTGVNALISSDNIDLYPNPATNVVNVQSTEGDIQLLIHALNGAVVQKERINSSTTSIDISSLQNGVYFFEFVNSSNEAIHMERVIVK